ncbi:MAG: AAA family ATPase [Gluconacetobacter diazotrophicus]|nr:AAA family ATPase [Gluconacetobacter diazotrophicus]
MLTRVEIDGFKTFEQFSLDLQPFSAIVGPNASGKSNLFDALRFLSLLAQTDIRSAMVGLRGEPEELFRRTAAGTANEMRFAIEVLLNDTGTDAFGTTYTVRAQRLRYELTLTLRMDKRGVPLGIYVTHERCQAIARKGDRAKFLAKEDISYSHRKNPFIDMSEDQSRVFQIRQDGPAESGTSKRGRPVLLSASEASRTALSTIATAEFPHLYALRDLLTSLRFLEINPVAARSTNDRYIDTKSLRSDASNLAAILAHLKSETSSEKRPDGVINDISADLSSLIPSVRKIEVFDEPSAKEYAFGVRTSDGLNFSSRIISDGTLRILALLAILDDPNRRGILCFEEPENGVHEGRMEALITLLRNAAELPTRSTDPYFQILVNTHSPAVLDVLSKQELIAADVITVTDPVSKARQTRTRMRIGPQDGEFDFEHHLTRTETKHLLRRPGGEV